MPSKLSFRSFLMAFRSERTPRLDARVRRQTVVDLCGSIPIGRRWTPNLDSLVFGPAHLARGGLVSAQLRKMFAHCVPGRTVLASALCLSTRYLVYFQPISHGAVGAELQH